MVSGMHASGLSAAGKRDACRSSRFHSLDHCQRTVYDSRNLYIRRLSMSRTHVAILVVLACAISLAAQERVTISSQTVLRGSPEATGEVVTTLQSSESADLLRTLGDWRL